MEEFTIKGSDGYFKILLTEVFGFPETTHHWGGYDTKATFELKIGGYYVKSDFYTSTGEIYTFFENLVTANKKISGKVEFSSYEGNLTFSLTYNNLGLIKVEGKYLESHQLENLLSFEFQSDQSYVYSSLLEIEKIVAKYGGLAGRK